MYSAAAQSNSQDQNTTTANNNEEKSNNKSLINSILLADEVEKRGPSSDRHGIMEKLKLLQEGVDVVEILGETDEKLPSCSTNNGPSTNTE